VCHGGSGSLLRDLELGIPTVVVPLFADKVHNAASVVRARAGVVVTDRTATQLRAAIERALEEGVLRETVRRIADYIVGMPPVEVAIKRMEELVAGGA